MLHRRGEDWEAIALSPKYGDYHLVYFFLALIALVILSPLVEEIALGKFVVQALFTLVIAVTVLVAGGNRRNMVIALCLAVPWLIMSWFGFVDAGRPAAIASGVLLILLNLFVFAVILARVRHAESVDINIINGALALYLLIGITWAVSYRVIELAAPGSFSVNAADPTWGQFLYFSLTTLTTLGYGDIAPTTPFARIWSTLESVTGVLYLAVLIARLVGLYRK